MNSVDIVEKSDTPVSHNGIDPVNEESSTLEPQLTSEAINILRSTTLSSIDNWNTIEDDEDYGDDTDAGSGSGDGEGTQRTIVMKDRSNTGQNSNNEDTLNNDFNLGYVNE